MTKLTISGAAHNFNKTSDFSYAMVEQAHISAETIKHTKFFVINKFIDSTHFEFILTVT